MYFAKKAFSKYFAIHRNLCFVTFDHMRFVAMRYLGFGLVFLLFANAYGQKACSCETMDKFIAERDLDSLKEYKEESLKIQAWRFLKLPSLRCKAYGNQLLAQYYIQQENYPKALIQLNAEQKKLDSLKCAGNSFLEHHITTADYLLHIGEYQKAVDLLKKNLSSIRKSGNSNYYSKTLILLSIAYSKLKDEKKALGEIKTAYEVIYKSPDGVSKADNLFRLSYRYYHHFIVTKREFYLDSSINIATFGLTLSKHYKYQDGLMQGYNLLENRAYYQRDFRLAILYLDSALMATNPYVNYNDREGIFSDKADIYLQLKKFSKAYECADSSLFYALKLGNPYRVQTALDLVYNTAKLSGDYERALSVYEDISMMQDSITKLQNSNRYSDLEDEYHRVKSEKSQEVYKQDKRLLDQQKEIGNLKEKLILVGVIIFALMAFYMIMVFRQKSIKQRQTQLESENRFNRSRINPDFIYGALQSIQTTKGNQLNEKDLAAFSKLMKRMVESANTAFFTLDKELEFIRLYLDIQRQKTGNKFNYHFEIDENLDLTDLCIPTMMIQPFLEYSIENGFRKIAYEGQITVRMVVTPNQELFVEIQDNGLGLKAQDFIRANQMIIDRMNMLNRINNSSHSFLVRERQVGGMQVDIYLPLISIQTAEKMLNEEV